MLTPPYGDRSPESPFPHSKPVKVTVRCGVTYPKSQLLKRQGHKISLGNTVWPHLTVYNHCVRFRQPLVAVMPHMEPCMAGNLCLCTGGDLWGRLSPSSNNWGNRKYIEASVTESLREGQGEATELEAWHLRGLSTEVGEGRGSQQIGWHAGRNTQLL